MHAFISCHENSREMTRNHGRITHLSSLERDLKYHIKQKYPFVSKIFTHRIPIKFQQVTDRWRLFKQTIKTPAICKRSLSLAVISWRELYFERKEEK